MVVYSTTCLHINSRKSPSTSFPPSGRVCWVAHWAAVSLNEPHRYSGLGFLTSTDKLSSPVFSWFCMFYLLSVKWLIITAVKPEVSPERSANSNSNRCLIDIKCWPGSWNQLRWLLLNKSLQDGRADRTSSPTSWGNAGFELTLTPESLKYVCWSDQENISNLTPQFYNSSKRCTLMFTLTERNKFVKVQCDSHVQEKVSCVTSNGT